MPLVAYDVALQTTGAIQTPFTTFQKEPPITEVTFIDSDLWVGPLPELINGTTIFDSCDPPGFQFNPVRQFGYRYSFVRALKEASGSSLNWDKDGKLQSVIMLSRLVHPTTIGFRYSAKAICEGGALRQVVPGPTQGLTSHAWVPRPDWRDWLTCQDVEKIRNLFRLYDESALPKRIPRAISHYIHAQHTYFFEQRIASLVTSFESLIKTDQTSGLTKLFCKRVAKLGEEIGSELHDKDIKRFYDDRSTFVHGSILTYTLEDEHPRRVYVQMEELLRKTLMRAISDPIFSAQFKDQTSIEAKFA